MTYLRLGFSSELPLGDPQGILGCLLAWEPGVRVVLAPWELVLCV